MYIIQSLKVRSYEHVSTKFTFLPSHEWCCLPPVSGWQLEGMEPVFFPRDASYRFSAGLYRSNNQLSQNHCTRFMTGSSYSRHSVILSESKQAQLSLPYLYDQWKIYKCCAIDLDGHYKCVEKANECQPNIHQYICKTPGQRRQSTVLPSSEWNITTSIARFRSEKTYYYLIITNGNVIKNCIWQYRCVCVMMIDVLRPLLCTS